MTEIRIYDADTGELVRIGECHTRNIGEGIMSERRRRRFAEASERRRGFAQARVEDLIKSAGSLTVSQEVMDRLDEIMIKWGTNIARLAVERARRDGRKKATADDIHWAAGGGKFIDTEEDWYDLSIQERIERWEVKSNCFDVERYYKKQSIR